jgi:hypothetical protein
VRDLWNDAWDNLNDWIVAHDQQLDLALLWYLAIGFGVLMLVEGMTWLVIRKQHDMTDVGVSLKHKKIAGALMFSVLSSLYALGLVVYYTKNAEVFGTWQRMGLRFVLAVGIGVAVIAGIQFIIALKTEDWGQAKRAAQQDATDVRQGETDVRQDATEVRQGQRDVDQNARDEHLTATDPSGPF